MTARMTSAVAAICLVVGCLSEEMFNATEAVGVIDAVESALHKLVDNPKLTQAQATEGKRVVDDVHRAITMVESNKTLSQEEKGRALSSAIDEVSALEQEWQKAAAAQDKVSELKFKLAEKQAELKKDQIQLKMAGVEKTLSNNKEEMSRLEAEQVVAKSHQAADKQDDTQREALAASLAKATAAGNKTGLATALTYLQARARNVSFSITAIDAAEKKQEAQLDETIAHPVPGDSSKKQTSLLRTLKKQEARAFRKARAVKTAELAELEAGIKDVQSGNIADLRQLMVKMQSEMKDSEARSHDFLY